MAKHSYAWCAFSPDGWFELSTLAPTRKESEFMIFPLMTEEFQRKYWMDDEGSARAYRRLGWKIIRVKVSPHGR